MSTALHFQCFEIHPRERRLMVVGVPVKPSARAFDILMALVERRDRVVSKSELLQIVWPNLVVEENNLQVHISALRKILGPAAISTVPGRGYCFTAESIAPVPSNQSGVTNRRSSDQPVGRSIDNGKTVSTHQHGDAGNLPFCTAPLYGRQAELHALVDLLLKQNLVTVVGAGGIGKTRLVQALSVQVNGQFKNGVWWVELASVNDPALVLPVVAQVLGMTRRELTLQELGNALRARELLLVLDNCEHLLDAVGDLVLALTSDAPKVRIMVTSQELLRVNGECVFKLPPLACPPSSDCEPSLALEFGAVKLFVERAQALHRPFRLDADNLVAVVDICQRLDGIALAIELAAARVELLGVHGIQQRLGERFRLLTGGARVKLRRHQTLRAALDWSYNLLSTEEQKVFRRLGVFSGGFVIEGVQNVAGDDDIDEWAVLEHLSSLVDKSLVLVGAGQRPRYSLLETTRAYAMEALAESGETDAWLARHARATRAVCEQAAKSRDIDWMWQEISNVRAAFAWAVRPQGDNTTAIALATVPSVVLAVAGMVTEALQRLLLVEPLINSATPTKLAAQYWQWLGRCGIDGRLPTSRCIDALERAESCFRELRSQRHLHACLRMRAEALLENGDLERAQSALQDARQMEEAGWTVADRMRRLRVEGLLHDASGCYKDSLATSQQALDMARLGGIDRYVLILLSDMALVRLKMGDAINAEIQFRELIGKARAQPSEGLTLAYAMVGLTAALIAQGRFAQAHEHAVHSIPNLRHSGIFIARCDIFAWLLASQNQTQAASRLIGASDAFHERGEIVRDKIELQARVEAFDLIVKAAPAGLIQIWMSQGAAATEDELAALVDRPVSHDISNSDSVKCA